MTSSIGLIFSNLAQSKRLSGQQYVVGVATNDTLKLLNHFLKKVSSQQWKLYLKIKPNRFLVTKQKGTISLIFGSRTLLPPDSQNRPSVAALLNIGWFNWSRGFHSFSKHRGAPENILCCALLIISPKLKLTHAHSVM